MWFLLLLASASAFSKCELNDDATACNETTVFRCLNVCGVYRSEGACNSIAVCNWTQTSSSCQLRMNETYVNCFDYTDAASCSEQPKCYLEAAPCYYGQSCYSKNNAACANAPNATRCASPNFASLGCNWTPQCFKTNHCGMATSFDQSGCTAVPGCFWQEHSSTENSTTREGKDCRACFTDPSNTVSEYLYVAARVGKTCNYTKDWDPSYFGVAVVKVAVAGPNCTGGVPAVKTSFLESCSNIPTPAPTAAPTTTPDAAAAAGLTTSLATLCLAALLA